MKGANPLLFPLEKSKRPARTKNGENKLSSEDRPVHDWYRFVLSFPPHLVREYLGKFGANSETLVLDPFCGTGTTLVECKKLGIPSVGLEANPMAYFASSVKVDWDVNPGDLREEARSIADRVARKLRATGVLDAPSLCGKKQAVDRAKLLTLPEEARKLLLTNSLSPLPLHKCLVLLEEMRRHRRSRVHRHHLLALAKALVTRIGNLHFGPEVGVGKIKDDAPVVTPWLAGVLAMADDLEVVDGEICGESTVSHVDARRGSDSLQPRSVGIVITSPPYPNEKDYTRTTRLESVILGLVRNRQELKSFKKSLIRSNTRNVYKGDDDDACVTDNAEVARIAEAIEVRRLELGKTSGFERLYAKVTKLYFGGMARHLGALRKSLMPGAYLAYVVGDQASYLRVMIRTGRILAQIAESLGYKVLGIDLFRTRLATATREQLREEVLVLQWPGSAGKRK